MAKLTFKTDKCKGCGLCVGACPKGVLALAEDKINQKGHPWDKHLHKGHSLYIYRF